MAPRALTCDGKQTILYLDGKQVDKADTATAILPGAIGVHDVYYTFGGLIDEVRVWRSALPEQTIPSLDEPSGRSHSPGI